MHAAKTRPAELDDCCDVVTDDVSGQTTINAFVEEHLTKRI